MIFKSQQVGKYTILLNDLVSINSDRIVCFQSALDQSDSLDSDCWDAFKAAISDAMRYKLQLLQKIRQHDEHVNNKMNILGKIYRAWVDLKVVVKSTTQRNLISMCVLNEEIALHAYSSALRSADLAEDIRQLLVEQERGIRMNHDLIRGMRDARHTISNSLIYFT